MLKVNIFNFLIKIKFIIGVYKAFYTIIKLILSMNWLFILIKLSYLKLSVSNNRLITVQNIILIKEINLNILRLMFSCTPLQLVFILSRKKSIINKRI
jgi:hypothetical protein